MGPLEWQGLMIGPGPIRIHQGRSSLVMEPAGRGDNGAGVSARSVPRTLFDDHLQPRGCGEPESVGTSDADEVVARLLESMGRDRVAILGVPVGIAIGVGLADARVVRV
jgi:hypothetical protein